MNFANFCTKIVDERDRYREKLEGFGGKRVEKAKSLIVFFALVFFCLIHDHDEYTDEKMFDFTTKRRGKIWRNVKIKR